MMGNEQGQAVLDIVRRFFDNGPPCGGPDCHLWIRGPQLAGFDHTDPSCPWRRRREEVEAASSAPTRRPIMPDRFNSTSEPRR